MLSPSANTTSQKSKTSVESLRPMRSFFPHVLPKVRNEDAITDFVDAFGKPGAIAKKLWHNRRSFRVDRRADGRRIQGTVAPHPESECSGKTAAFVHPTRAQPHRTQSARTGCSPHLNVPAHGVPHSPQETQFMSARRMGAPAGASNPAIRVREGEEAAPNRNRGAVRLARHAACLSASRLSIQRRTAGFDPTQVVVAKEKPPR
ncbi:hypothetical protein SAMN05421548_11855 [Paraburkholderia lycopersici]|uniref:Uncharacterized protein n=1 Tax=Paraburkholderia lycopersici TaxID=416944 RepID=A0A1G6U505_9BURK|nr:hypothetical protein SAMN05421548_11855 [Paraburkholderia lycopersici]